MHAPTSPTDDGTAKNRGARTRASMAAQTYTTRREESTAIPGPGTHGLMGNVHVEENYLITMLMVLWMWQQAFKQVRVRTIPYSEFKEDVTEGLVVSCAVREDEIDGKIQPKTAAEPAQKAGGTPAASPAAATPAKARPPAHSKKAAGTPEAAATPGKAEEKNGKKAAPATPPAVFEFRTERVEDPDLVRDLVKAKVTFQRGAPGVSLAIFVVVAGADRGDVFDLAITGAANERGWGNRS